MEWTKFNTHGESPNHAFEVMCNILFEGWCKTEYKDELKYFSFVNGSGGDGGVEAYAVLNSGDIIGVQSKWFPSKMNDEQFIQIENSFNTAVRVRPKIKRYIVCVPRDLSSKKMVKNDQVAKNTEDSKWLKLIDKLQKTNPSVVVNLWDETTIQSKLLTSESLGCHKYWFDNTELFDNEIVGSYDRAINSWAKTKYISDLYSTGYIHNQLEDFAVNYSVVSKRYNEVKKILSIFEALKKAYRDMLILKFPEKDRSIVKKIQCDIELLDEWIIHFKEIEPIVANGGNVKEDFLNEKIELNCTKIELKKCSLYPHHYFHFYEVIKILEHIERDVFKCCQTLNNDFDDNRIIFLGNQGTGKTAGIVCETNIMLQEKTHLPILVHAKDFSIGDNWLSILLKTLELPYTWSDRELLKALENAALLRNKFSNDNQVINIQPKCLICVDGIDEAASWSFWKERIEEAKTYEKDFAGIKFVFLSRPYVFQNYCKLDYNYCFYRLPSSGDVSVTELFNSYINFYNIDIDGNVWIKEMLRTPIALKLFCDLYKNSRISSLQKSSVVISNLFQEKINSVECEYRRAGKETDNQSMVWTVLIIIATKLIDKIQLSYNDIYNMCNEPIKSHLEEILKFVEKEGFLYSRQIQKDSFSIPETVYSWGMQPAFDYLIAKKLFDTIKENKNIETEYTKGIYQMLSLIAIEEDNKFVFEYPNIKLNKDTNFELICYALANASAEIAGKYRDYVKKLMAYSVDEFREIFDRIILPVSNVPNHPLGSILLDEFLRDFVEPAKRDIWWSIPTYLKDNYGACWRSYTDIDTTSVKLSNDDNYLGLPLLLVWRLSSVNNKVRYECRLKLTKWGIDNSEQFFMLLIYCADINDEQIIEDIFSVAYGIALGQYVKDEYLSKMTTWIMENVFSDAGLIKYENVVVRYYCKGIVEMAISRNLYDKDKESKLIPPYDYNACIMPAYEKAFEAKRMFGYEPIDYDLARYVLCEQLDCFFEFNHKTKTYSKGAEKFIGEYKKRYGINLLEPDSLIISIAYQYILNQGWEKKTFWEYKDKENIGVDIAIRSTFYPSTHGQMSSVMTVAEKYVWCVKHRIEAVLANRMMSRDLEGNIAYINDYSDLENFTNTYQDYINSKQKEQEELWFHTDQMVCSKYEEYSIENIENWMTNGDVPDFKTWIKDNHDETMLYAFTSIINELAGIKENIWISSGAVKCDEFDSFIKALNIYSEDRMLLLNVADFHAYQKCRCYCTPQEACTVQSNREVEESIFIGQDDSTVELYKLITSCTTSYAEKIENIFYLPSKLTRTITGITYGDGYKYLNKDGDLISRYTESGENLQNQQKCLLINSSILNESLEQNQYKIFWIFRVYRCPSNKAYEALGEQIMHDTDRTFATWFDGDECKFVELPDIEPPRICTTDYKTLVKVLYSDTEE